MKKSFTVSGLVDSGTILDKPNPSVLTKFKDQSDFTSNNVLNIPLSKIQLFKKSVCYNRLQLEKTV